MDWKDFYFTFENYIFQFTNDLVVFKNFSCLLSTWIRILNTAFQ